MRYTIFAVIDVRTQDTGKAPYQEDQQHPEYRRIFDKDTDQDQNNAANNGLKTTKPLTFLPDPVICHAPLGTKAIESIDACLRHIVSEDDK